MSIYNQSLSTHAVLLGACCTAYRRGLHCTIKYYSLGVFNKNVYFQFIKQSKFFLVFFHKAPLTRTDTLTLGGSLDVKNGTGNGSVSVSAKRTLSHRSWGEVSEWLSLAEPFTDSWGGGGGLPIINCLPWGAPPERCVFSGFR